MEDNNLNDTAQTIKDASLSERRVPNSYQSKKALKEEQRTPREHSKKRFKMFFWIVPSILFLALVVWLFTLPRKQVSSALPGKNHIHANLKIVIDGERLTIPGGIGIPPGGGAMHIPGAQKVIHTHVDNDQLHMEAVDGGPLYEDDVKISKFFEIWGKDFSSGTILGHAASSGIVEFNVNGKPNTEYENYHMRDGDDLEIIYISYTLNAANRTASTSADALPKP